jgi:GxxExxY protein
MQPHDDERERLNQLSNVIIGAALRVHDELGPGMLESAYEACLMFELVDKGLRVEREKPLPLVYPGYRLDCGYRLDLLVEGAIIVEVKAIERLERVHSAQLLSYLRQLKTQARTTVQLQCEMASRRHHEGGERISRVEYSLRALRALRSNVIRT